jgi:hypothetical protein
LLILKLNQAGHQLQLRRIFFIIIIIIFPVSCLLEDVCMLDIQ